MKHSIFIFFFLVSFFVACKKNEEGKHCPLITETYTGDLVDLSPVSSFPGIMDSLRKYPELQVYRLGVTRAIYDPTVFTANVKCHVSYKGIIIYSLYHYYSSNNTGTNYQDPATGVSTDIPVSLDPAISIEQADKIARAAATFEHCTISRLGLNNYGSAKAPGYKLIWRIKESKNGYPSLDIDAQSGEILALNENGRID